MPRLVDDALGNHIFGGWEVVGGPKISDFAKFWPKIGNFGKLKHDIPLITNDRKIS